MAIRIPQTIKTLRDTGSNAPADGQVLAWDGGAGRARWSAGAGAGDKTYLHTQGVAASTWVIPHGLGKYPTIQTFEDFGSGGTGEILGQIFHVDINTAIVRFNATITGIAACN